MPGMKVVSLLGCFWSLLVLSCQEYSFVFEPKTDRIESVLRFAVETPSKADILFVVDNSSSMGEEQAALAEGFEQMLEVLAPTDTNYRIGIISTDAHGFQADCCGEPNPLLSYGGYESVFGAKGNCSDCGCESGCDFCEDCSVQVKINRPHDGTRGRLIAAYDAGAFARERHPELSDDAWALTQLVFPTSLNEVPPVIDRNRIGSQACLACGCDSCDDSKTCSEEEQRCISELSTSMVRALFQSNLSGLGVSGFGWEEGLKSALLAVGIDAEEPTDDWALAPAASLVQEGAPNTVEASDGTWEPWVREDALLALMIVTDEDDCSMPQYLMNIRHTYEEGIFPEGSMCYQEEARARLLSADRMANLLLASKDRKVSRLAYGFIGGVRPSDDVGIEWRNGQATDCASLEDGSATFGCSCLEGADSEDFNAWCGLTQDTSGNGPVCSGLAGKRYLEFGTQFKRRTYDSICEEGNDNSYGSALERFANLATLACFELNGLRPVGGLGDNIQVSRVDRDDPQEKLVILPRTQDSSSLEGWYYVPDENKVCLSQLNRRVGDYYEIRVVHRDEELFNQ